MDETTGSNIIPFPGTNRRDPAAPTFSELAEEWFKTEGARLVEPANERRHLAHLRQLWDLTEADLRPRRVKEALAMLLRPVGALSAATVNKIQGTGRRIIREAQINERWFGANPFEVVRRMRETRPTHRVLSLSEVRQVLPVLRADRRREVLMMLYLGPRPGEWKALRRDDVDLERGEILFHRSNSRNQTKTGKQRRVPIPNGLRPALDEALSVSPSCDLVFPALNCRIQRPDAKLSRMLQGALVRAGVISSVRYICRRKGCGHTEERRTVEELHCPVCNMKLWASGVAPRVRYYDLRHSAATLHREAGCDPLVIQVVLGHAAENLTDSIYTHLSIEYVRKELNKLDI